METVLVTGATGFLGKHLVERLVVSQPDVRVRALSRSGLSWGNSGLVEGMAGDITRREDVFRAAEGVSEIYHLAGIVSRDPRHAERLYQTHVEGTRNVCEAALRVGVRKIVHVSSSGTIAVGREPVARDEGSGYTNDLVGEWPYYFSKIFAEKLALDYFGRHALPVVVVNPSLLLGPGDERSSSTGDVALFLRGQIKALPLGGLSFADVRDVAAGVIAAMRSGRAGERYLLGGANWTFRNLIETVATITSVRAPRIQPSLKMSLASARLLRRFLPLIGGSFALDDASIKMSALFWYCDSSKARRELGYSSRDPLETLRDTVQDLRRRAA